MTKPTGGLQLAGNKKPTESVVTTEPLPSRIPDSHLNIKYSAAGIPLTQFSAIEGMGGVGIAIVFLRNITADPRLSIGIDIALGAMAFLVVWVFLGLLDSPFQALDNVYQDKVKRIYPGLLLLVMATLGMVAVFGNREEFGEALLSGSASLVGLANYQAVISLEPIGGGPGTTDALYHLWALSLLMQFLVFYPLLTAVLARLTRRNLPFLLLVTVGLFVASAWYMSTAWTGFNVEKLFYGTFTRSMPMLAGAAAAIIRFMYETRLGQRVRPGGVVRRRRSAWSYVFLTFTGVAAAVLLTLAARQMTYYSKPWTYEGGYAFTAVMIGVLLLTLTSRRNFFSLILGFSLLSGLGRISFALFMVQYPILWFFRTMTPASFTHLPLAIATGITSLVVALLIHLFVLAPGARMEWKLSVVVPVAALTILFLALAGQPYIMAAIGAQVP